MKSQTVNTITTLGIFTFFIQFLLVLCVFSSTTLVTAQSSIQHDYDPNGDTSFQRLYTPPPGVSSLQLEQCLESGLKLNNWKDVLEIPKFDATLGKLMRVEIEIQATVKGTMQVLKPEFAGTQLKITSDIKLTLPNNTDITVQPSVELSAAAKDKKVPITEATSSERQQADYKGNINDFIGTGKMRIPVSGSGLTIAKSKESPIQLTSYSGVRLCIRYHYTTDN